MYFHEKTAAQKIREDASIDAEGVVTWNSNGHVPFDDMLEAAMAEGVSEIDLDACRKARKAQNDKFCAEYRKQMANHVPSGEELFEMEAAFGKGAEVVNIITGKVTKL